jgi:hypothetical protein
MHRNEKHWLTDEEVEEGITFGETLEAAVIEIRNLMPRLKSAFSGVELMAEAVRAKELGFDRHTSFWPTTFSGQALGIAWVDSQEVVAELDPPNDPEPGWKLDPRYGDRLRYWWGDEWDALAAPAPGNLDAYRRIEAGENVDAPEPPPVSPVG